MRKIWEEQNIEKKGYDQARCRTRVRIWEQLSSGGEKLKEREGLESDAEVALYLLDRWVTLICIVSSDRPILIFFITDTDYLYVYVPDNRYAVGSILLIK